MTSYNKQEDKLSGCFDQELFGSLGKCFGKSTYSQLIFDSGCLEDGATEAFDKEKLEDPNSVESASLEYMNPMPGACETKVNAERSINVPIEEKPTGRSSAGKKRKRPSAESSNEETDDFKSHLYSMLEASGRVLTAHVESHNFNSELDRNQRKEHAESLVSVLGKLADALGKIAERL